MKIYFKNYTFLLAIVFIFLIGCQKDDEQITKEVLQEIVKPESTTTSLLSGKDLDTDIIYKEMIKDGGFVNHIYDPHEEPFKVGAGTPFTIKIDQAREELGENYKALTFVVNRVNKPIYDTDNLVLSDRNGTRKAYWYTYHFTEEIYRTYTNDEVFEIDLPYTVRELSLSGQILKVNKGVQKFKREATKELNKVSGCFWVPRAGPMNCYGAGCCNCHTPARANHCTCIDKGGNPPGYGIRWIRLCGTGGETSSENGPLSMGYVTAYGEIHIGRSPVGNAQPSGGGLGGGGGEIEEPFLNPEEHGIMFFANVVGLDAAQRNWLFQRRNRDILPEIARILNRDGYSTNAMNLAKSLVEFGRRNNSELAKRFIREATNAALHGTDFDATPYVKKTTPTRAGETANCGTCPISPNVDELWEFGPGLLQNGLDGLFSIALAAFEYNFPDPIEGAFVRQVMKDQGVDVPSDVTNRTLGEHFKIRKEGLRHSIQYETGIGADIADLAINVLDVVTIFSPSKGGGAFLAARGGERVTVASFRQFLNKLKESFYKPTGPMVGKRIGHTFEKHGLHNTNLLKMIAKNGNIPQGQWLNEIEAEKFIARHLSQLGNGARDIPIPANLRNIGRVFRNGDAAILSPTHIRLVPSGSGVKSAFPINSTIESLLTLGTYIP